MKLSKMHINTLREVPAEAEVPSHVWLLRSGMIRKIVSGIYGFMPLGYRSVRKIEEIVREEMDAKGCQEIHMSAVQPAELWQESGRWSVMGPEMWRLQDRHKRDFCLGPTHEEIFTDIIRNEVSSYRQLPMNLYQIQTKYRDEARPRFGLIRSREFVMKDAYSFDLDEDGLNESYEQMFDAYSRVFDRCGLKYRPVFADSGSMGGSGSQEFIAFSDQGESEIVYCETCGFAATTEQAESVDSEKSDEAEKQLKETHTPGTETIQELAGYLGIPTSRTLKALLFVTYDQDGAEKEYVAAFIRGNRELNMTKLVNALGIPEHSIEFADEKKAEAKIGCVGGFTGPMGLHDCKIIVDSEIPGQKNLCTGACKADFHVENSNYGRDYKADILTDLKLVTGGDPCPVCGNELKQTAGTEVGQIFKLGTKYSESMGATYKDENMEDKLIVMGCYGIGVTRTLAAVVDQNYDENGIIWPIAIAPYHVIITIVKADDEDQSRLANEIYEKLMAKGIEVLLDDRNERAGVKFKDADIMGIPIRITVGKKATDNIVEYKLRRDKDRVESTAEEAIKSAIETIGNEIGR